MSELIDSVKAKLDSMEGGGLKTSNLLDFPAGVRRIVRQMLRGGGVISHDEARAILAETDDTADLTDEECRQIMDLFCQAEWFGRQEQADGSVVYAVQMGQAFGTQRVERKKKTAMPDEFWDSIGAESAKPDLKTEAEPAQEPRRRRPDTSALFDAITDEGEEKGDESEPPASSPPTTIPTAPPPPTPRHDTDAGEAESRYEKLYDQRHPNPVGQLLRVEPGEWRLVIVMALLLVFNSIALEVSGVVAVSGFLSQVETSNILWVWMADMALIMGVSALQSLIVDRFDRIQLLRWMIFGFGLAYVLLRLLFTFNAPGWFNYSVLYLLTDLQLLVFPLIFWILANDVFSMSQAKRLFPLIAAGGFGGQMLGLVLASSAPRITSATGVPASELLTFVALVYLFAFLLVSGGLQNIRLRDVAPQVAGVRAALEEGWGFVKDVPAFRFLAIAILALTITDTMIEFRFLSVTDLAIANGPTYQTFYGLYRMGVVFFAFFIQSLLTSRIIQRIELKNTFLIMPFALLIGIVWLLATPGIISAVGAMVLLRLTRDTVDDSALKSFQGLVPEERRGRVSMFIESYLVAAAVILGAALIGLTLLLGTLFNLDAFSHYLYLGIGLAMAVLALWLIFRMRTVYDSSMLNWRLKRRQRGASILDKLDF